MKVASDNVGAPNYEKEYLLSVYKKASSRG